MERSERGLCGAFDTIGDGLFRRLVAGTKKAEPINQLHLFDGRTADEAAVIELCRGQRARKSGLAARDPGHSALDEQSGSDDPAPGGDSVETTGRLVRARLKVASAARQSVQKRRAVT